MALAAVELNGRFAALRPLEQSDKTALVEAGRDGDVCQSRVTTIPSLDTVDDYVATALSQRALGNALPFVIIRNSDQRVVGCTRFFDYFDKHRRLEIGYTWMGKSAQRTAINTEIKFMMMRHAFEVWQCFRVQFLTDVLNTQSRNAIERLGAIEEGVLRGHMQMPDGRVRDSVCYSILATDWPKISQRLSARLERD